MSRQNGRDRPDVLRRAPSREPAGSWRPITGIASRHYIERLGNRGNARRIAARYLSREIPPVIDCLVLENADVERRSFVPVGAKFDPVRARLEPESSILKIAGRSDVITLDEHLRRERRNVQTESPLPERS